MAEDVLRFRPDAPEPPPMTTGDKVTVIDLDGVMELRVVAAEHWTDEDGVVGQRITFGPAD